MIKAFGPIVLDSAFVKVGIHLRQKCGVRIGIGCINLARFCGSGCPLCRSLERRFSWFPQAAAPISWWEKRPSIGIDLIKYRNWNRSAIPAPKFFNSNSKNYFCCQPTPIHIIFGVGITVELIIPFYNSISLVGSLVNILKIVDHITICYRMLV